jgi:hypothetical protein
MRKRPGGSGHDAIVSCTRMMYDPRLMKRWPLESAMLLEPRAEWTHEVRISGGDVEVPLLVERRLVRGLVGDRVDDLVSR